MKIPQRRPSKYMVDAVTMLRETLERGRKSECLTDEDAICRMNDMLAPYGQRICFRTFQRYKAAAKAFGEMELEEQAKFDPIMQDLYRTFQRSQIDQKENLYCAMMDAEGSQWIKYRWALERKFPDFNMRKVTEKYLAECEVEKLLMQMDLAAMGIYLPMETATTPAAMPIQQAPQPTMEATVTQHALTPETPPAETTHEEEEEEEEMELPPPPPPLRTPEQIKEFEKSMDGLERFMDPEKVAMMRQDYKRKYGIRNNRAG